MKKNFQFYFCPYCIECCTLKGHVKYDGKAPKPKRLRMDADPGGLSLAL